MARVWLGLAGIAGEPLLSATCHPRINLKTELPADCALTSQVARRCAVYYELTLRHLFTAPSNYFCGRCDRGCYHLYSHWSTPPAPYGTARVGSRHRARRRLGFAAAMAPRLFSRRKPSRRKRRADQDGHEHDARGARLGRRLHYRYRLFARLFSPAITAHLALVPRRVA
jgi:hypothetical protein